MSSVSTCRSQSDESAVTPRRSSQVVLPLPGSPTITIIRCRSISLPDNHDPTTGYNAHQMNERIERGIRLFNNREFFECHEVLEEEWTPETGARRLFLQSLIHVAVGLYHAERGNR